MILNGVSIWCAQVPSTFCRYADSKIVRQLFVGIEGFVDKPAPSKQVLCLLACTWVACSILQVCFSFCIFLFLVVAKTRTISSVNRNRGSILAFFLKKILHSMILPVSTLVYQYGRRAYT